MRFNHVIYFTLINSLSADECILSNVICLNQEWEMNFEVFMSNFVWNSLLFEVEGRSNYWSSLWNNFRQMLLTLALILILEWILHTFNLHNPNSIPISSLTVNEVIYYYDPLWFLSPWNSDLVDYDWFRSTFRDCEFYWWKFLEA